MDRLLQPGLGTPEHLAVRLGLSSLQVLRGLFLLSRELVDFYYVGLPSKFLIRKTLERCPQFSFWSLLKRTHLFGSKIIAFIPVSLASDNEQLNGLFAEDDRCCSA